MRRVFAFDLDGTVATSDRLVPEATLASVASIHDLGDLVVFITGRRQVDMSTMQGQMLVADYVVLNNGAYIFKPNEGTELYHQRVCPQDSRPLIEACLASGYVLDVITDDEWYANVMTEGDVSYGAKIGRFPTIFSSVDQIDLDRVEGFMIAGAVDEMRELIRSRGLGLQCVPSEPRCADIMDARAGKWRALERICSVEGVDPGRVVAVGNYTNDIEMITRAGLGVAVADALPEVRAVADLVLGSAHDQNPVEELLARVGPGGPLASPSVHRAPDGAPVHTSTRRNER